MRFVSWNIAGGHTFKKSVEDAVSYEKEDLDYFISELRKTEADIVALQEVHTPIDPHERSQAEIIAAELGLNLAGNHVYQDRSHIKAGNQLSLSILSRYPARDVDFHKVPNPGLTVTRPNGDMWKTFDVGFLSCAVDYKRTRINISDGHMVPFHYFHRDFLEPAFGEIRNSITELFISLSKQPTLIGADFNYNDLQALLPHIFEGKEYQEAFVGTETTPGRGQQDHVLFSRQWNFKKSEVRKANADHFICISDLELS
jgi:hypothetical protein